MILSRVINHYRLIDLNQAHRSLKLIKSRFKSFPNTGKLIIRVGKKKYCSVEAQVSLLAISSDYLRKSYLTKNERGFSPIEPENQSRSQV